MGGSGFVNGGKKTFGFVTAFTAAFGLTASGVTTSGLTTFFVIVANGCRSVAGFGTLGLSESIGEIGSIGLSFLLKNWKGLFRLEIAGGFSTFWDWSKRRSDCPDFLGKSISFVVSGLVASGFAVSGWGITDLDSSGPVRTALGFKPDFLPKIGSGIGTIGSRKPEGFASTGATGKGSIVGATDRSIVGSTFDLAFDLDFDSILGSIFGATLGSTGVTALGAIAGMTLGTIASAGGIYV